MMGCPRAPEEQRGGKIQTNKLRMTKQQAALLGSAQVGGFPPMPRAASPAVSAPTCMPPPHPLNVMHTAGMAGMS